MTVKKSTIHKVLSLLPLQFRFKVILVFIGNLIGNFLEIIGIGILPIFILNIMAPEKLKEFLIEKKLSSLVKLIEYENILLIGILGLIFFFLIKNLYLLMMVYMQRKLGIKIINYNKSTAYKSYISNNYEMTLKKSPSVLLSFINNEIPLALNLVELFLLIIRETTVIFLILLAILFLNYKMTLIITLTLAIYLFLFVYLLKNYSSTAGKVIQAQTLKSLKIVNETFDLIKEIIIYKKEKYFSDIFDKQEDYKEKMRLLNATLNALPRLLLEIGLLIMILVIILSNQLLNNDVISIIPTLSFLAVASLRLIPAFKVLSSSFNQINYYKPSLDLVFDEFELLKKSKLKSYEHDHEDNSIDIEFNKKITITNLNFQYDGLKKNIINNISLEILKSEKVGIIGKSGTGKTTLINLILGLLKPSSGQILSDNKDINSSLGSWYKKIGYVPQEISLLDDSIKRNIAFGLHEDDIDPNKIEKAVNLSRVSDFADKFSDKLETIIGNKGVQLSGGQRQRIGIARALYNEPEILILDEATNSLDDFNEKQIISQVTTLKNITILIIAHRTESLASCDKIIYLENGSLKEIGKYNDIINKHNIK